MPGTNYYLDADGDTYGGSNTIAACTQPSNGYTTNTDCNDNVMTINPGAAETCNNLDDNCNGTIDEGTYLCSPITTVTVNTITNTTAKVNWASLVSCGLSYRIFYRNAASASSAWLYAQTTGPVNQYTLASLTPCARYYARVRRNCAGTNVSTLSLQTTFTTTGCPKAPPHAMMGGNSSNLNVYPNPTRGLIHLNLDNQAAQEVRYSIFDMSGRVLLSWTGYPTDRADVGDLPAGLYQVRADYDGQFEIQSFIKE